MEFLLRPGQEVLFAGDGEGGFIFPDSSLLLMLCLPLQKYFNSWPVKV